MGLEEILSSIESETEIQYSKIISDAKAEAARTLAEAKARAELISSQGKNDSQRQAQEEKLRSVASARLEAKRKILEVRDEVLRSYENQVMGDLKEFAKSQDYNDFFLRMVKDGVSKIGEGSVVFTNSSDRKLLGNPGGEEFSISPEPIDSIGGAIVSSKDGKRRVDNTLESIFNDRREDFRLKLSEEVFGRPE